MNIASASYIYFFFFHSFSFSFRSSRFLFSSLSSSHSSICSSLNVPISSSSVNNFLQCVSVDGQIGFVYNSDVEPLHVISISKQLITTTSNNHHHSTMSNFFHRKTGLIIHLKLLTFY